MEFELRLTRILYLQVLNVTLTIASQAHPQHVMLVSADAYCAAAHVHARHQRRATAQRHHKLWCLRAATRSKIYHAYSHPYWHNLAQWVAVEVAMTLSRRGVTRCDGEGAGTGEWGEEGRERWVEKGEEGGRRIMMGWGLGDETRKSLILA